jgi:hypothetical protein
LLVASWAIRKFEGFFIRSSGVNVYLPLAEMVSCVNDKRVGLKLKARLLELRAMDVQFKQGKSAWAIVGEIMKLGSP